MLVNRCICHEITFQEIKEIASRNSLNTLEQLRAENVCSTQCRLCEPYIRQMLHTGETAFEPGLLTKSDLTE